MPRARPRKKSIAFVVTLAVAPSCKKADVEAYDPAHVDARTDGAYCLYFHKSTRCGEGRTCNPPGPEAIECPPGIGDAAAPTSSARPPGKEGWYRIPAQLIANPFNGCFFEIEGYCAPIEIDRCERGGDVKVACKAIDASLSPDKRRYVVEPFDYKDSFGVCHRTERIECNAGSCPMPPMTTVPCAE